MTNRFKEIISDEMRKQRLYDLCREFVDSNGIFAAESIIQCDYLQEKIPEFIEDICEIVGYAEVDWSEDEDEDEP